MRPPVDVGVHRAPRCEPVVSLVRSRRAPPVPLIVLPKSCSCRWGPCPRPIPRLACLFSFFLSFRFAHATTTPQSSPARDTFSSAGLSSSSVCRQGETHSGTVPTGRGSKGVAPQRGWHSSQRPHLRKVGHGSPRNFLANTRAPPSLRRARCGRTSNFLIVPRRAA